MGIGLGKTETHQGQGACLPSQGNIVGGGESPESQQDFGKLWNMMS